MDDLNNDSSVVSWDKEWESGLERTKRREPLNFSSLFHREKLLFQPSMGKVLIISATPEFQLPVKNKLDISFMASLAVVGNAMVLRSTILKKTRSMFL